MQQPWAREKVLRICLLKCFLNFGDKLTRNWKKRTGVRIIALLSTYSDVLCVILSIFCDVICSLWFSLHHQFNFYVLISRLLQMDPELFQTYKDLVVSGIITPEEFWTSHSGVRNWCYLSVESWITVGFNLFSERPTDNTCFMHVIETIGWIRRGSKSGRIGIFSCWC